MFGNNFSIRKNRIEQGYYRGFVLAEDGTLSTDDQCQNHYLYLRAIDSGVLDATWGRMSVQCKLADSSVLIVYATAHNEDSFYREGELVKIVDFLCNPEESHAIKKEFYKQVNGKKFINQGDALLYGLKGRYLYLMLEVVGGEPSQIESIRINQQGDQFISTFPGVYQERNSFFHRYLSVFSSIYNDFQDRIDDVADLLDLETCPTELLPVYAGWLGIEIWESFEKEPWLRTLVQEAYQLNRMKGTKSALERVAEIVLDEKVLVLESNVMRQYVEEEQLANFKRLYGNSRYDVTVLVKKELTGAERGKLLFLLEQFKPIRCRLHIMNLQQNGMLNSHSYLDMNSKMVQNRVGCLDDRQNMDDVIQIL